MHARTPERVMMALGTLTLMWTAGCAGGEGIAVTNEADVVVTVHFGEADIGEVPTYGGVVLVEATDCYDGPIVVTYAGGRVVGVDGPICPGQTLEVSDASAQVVDMASPE